MDVFLGNGDGTVRPSLSYTAGILPQSVVVGDFNGDGKTDLAVANSNSNNVSILLGYGDGTFQIPMNYAVGNKPRSIAIGDFNGDGKADLAVANSTDGTVSVLSGNGDGTFQTGVTYDVGGSHGYDVAAVAVGPFKPDGRTDIAATGNEGVIILLNTAPTPDLAIANTDGGNFSQGEIGATYTITVSNLGSAATSGTVTVTDVLPGGITGTELSGTGWICTLTSVTCTRSDSLPAGSLYPAITIRVNVDAGAPSSVITTAAVSGGGETNFANDTANDVTQIIAVGIRQTILFPALSNRTLGAMPFPIVATASSGLTVNFISNTPSVCTVSGTTVTLVAAGTCSITATQGGNAEFAAAAPVTQGFLVSGTNNLNSQTITFGALTNVTFGAVPFTVNAMASSGLPVSFASTPTAVCTVSGSTLTIVATGTCSITATQAGNGNYNAATPVVQSFTVHPASQTISFLPISNV
ncbi:MAG: VCBS repeat-containing protein, partial [Verrucomicrobia bacterium]|nr:VCBS repeat-containing protein [Verrucomicrobiota bacterium]